MEKHNQSYTKRELLQSESFLRWRYFPTKEDKHFWEKLQEDPVIKAEMDAAMDVLHTVRFNPYTLSDSESADMLSQIERRIQVNKIRQKKRLYIAAAVAAIAFLLFVFSFSFFMKQKIPQITEDPGVSELMENNEDIQIIMGSESLSIEKDADLLYNENGDMTILKENEKIIENKKVENTQMNKLIVPRGKRSSLTLSDGSRIWINSGSILEFPAVFEGNTREIKVEGEIYIEVTPNKDKPFWVTTSGMSVKVLGTSFNLSAYKEDGSSSVVLVKGAVEVISGEKAVNLLPDQRASVTGGDIETQVVDVYNYISWKDGLMSFTSEPLSDITSRLMRYYNRTIVCREGTADLICTGKLVLYDNLEEVLETITVTNPVKYTITDDIIYLWKK